MKKLFTVLAMASVMISCDSKKKESTPGEDKSATTVAPPAAPPSTPASDVPKFSDPEVQKAANDYAAFMAEYIAAKKDPAKLTAMQKDMGEWMDKSEQIHSGLAQKPDEATAWANWAMKLLDEATAEAPKGN
ncbi:MAG: hypothetical protein JST23_13230 [Bacteroidetes bacterium]|nr:hypothetical protein [Bacteroidota bacterium]